MTRTEMKNYLLGRFESQARDSATISTKEVASVLGCGRTKAREYTHGLPSLAGKRYLIPAVVDKVLDSLRYS